MGTREIQLPLISDAIRELECFCKVSTRIEKNDFRRWSKLVDHVQQCDVFERARHCDVIVEQIKGQAKDLVRGGVLDALIHDIELVQERRSGCNYGHSLREPYFL